MTKKRFNIYEIISYNCFSNNTTSQTVMPKYKEGSRNDTVIYKTTSLMQIFTSNFSLSDN